MKKLRVLIGLPLSGKSTYAMKLLQDEKDWFRVSRDDIRITMFGTEHDISIEGFVSKVQNMLLLKALKADKNVVVDNCNIRASYRNELFQLARSVGDVLYEEVVFNTSLQECIERNKSRARKVPEDVLVKFAKEGRDILWGKYKPHVEFIAKSETSSLMQDPTLPKAIMCDLDGTMALMNGRNPFDASTCDQDLPNTPVIETLKLFDDAGYTIIFCSGREDKFKEPTERFISQHFTSNKQDYAEKPFERSYYLYMRKTGDQRKDSIIKREIFEAHILNKFNILFVLDDRNQVVEGWREIGLTCFQVAEGDF